MKNKITTLYELMGLIKDDKAPKKIKYDGKEYYYNFGDYYSVKDINLFNNIELKLEVTVEILPEENDEWEDIKYYEIEGSPDSLKISQDYLRDIKCTMVEGLLAETINKLIKNQKYLKERLDKDDR